MTASSPEVVSEHRSFGGIQRFYKHASEVIGLPMKFSVYLPPQSKIDAAGGKVPLLTYLAGLTCTEETFMIKGGAQRLASELGIALLAPDTSPRGANIEGDSASWDFGVGAGFYLDATQLPWAKHYKMESYIVDELLPLVAQTLPVDLNRAGIFGHSMGGHGALTLALRHRELFKSVSAFAPIAAPTQCPWGEKAFGGYLGPDRETWKSHDATELMQAQPTAPFLGGILIDQGTADSFLEKQLHPHLFEAACKKVGQSLTLRMHEGYDHGYYFISTFMDDHLRHHSAQL